MEEPAQAGGSRTPLQQRHHGTDYDSAESRSRNPGGGSRLSDVQETVWDDVGLVTCWLEQDYTYQGQPQHVSAPTSAVFRRTGGEWRIVMLHTIPLPEMAP